MLAVSKALAAVPGVRVRSVAVGSAVIEAADGWAAGNAVAALEVVSHGYLMENGRIVMHDSAEAMKRNPDIQEFYLGGSEGKNFRDIKHYSRRKRWLS